MATFLHLIELIGEIMDNNQYKQALYITLIQGGFITSPENDQWILNTHPMQAFKGVTALDSSKRYSKDEIVDQFVRAIQNVDVSHLRAA